MSSSQQHVLAVNGIELSVRVSGPEHGQPVWLLHGFPECWHSWRHQVPALVAAGFRVFVPEMRGYGRSSAPEACLLYTSPSPRDRQKSRMPSSA